jgi:hypothetical protein
MAAPTIVRTTAYRIVVGFKPGLSQNGGPSFCPE